MSSPPSSRTVVGPVIGGYLAEPVKKYPSLFRPDTVWERFPYLLPNLVVVVFLLASAVSGFLGLQEVHPRFQGQIDLGRKVSAAIQSLVRSRKRSDQKGRYASIRTEEDPIELTHVAESIADTRTVLEPRICLHETSHASDSFIYDSGIPEGRDCRDHTHPARDPITAFEFSGI
jgi:hypothetical protein